MQSVFSAAISCRRCRCTGIYSGRLDVTRTTECAECRHPLFRDHAVSLKGIADPVIQFVVITDK